MKFSAKSAVAKSMLAALLLIVTATNAYGFDGKRKGFQIGLGIGAHTSAFTFEPTNTPDEVDSEKNLATQLHIGYGVSNQFTLYLGGKGGAIVMNEEDATVAFSGVGATFYLSPSSPSLYVTGLVGRGSLSLESDKNLEINGDGWLAGIGYEVTDRLHLELSYGEALLVNVDNEADKYTMESGFATIQYIWY